MRLGRIAFAAFVAAGLLAGTGSRAAGQFGVSVGSSLYSDDHDFCIMSGAAITHYQLDYSGDVFGVSASYVNSNIPWLIPPGSGGAALIVPAAALVAHSRQGPVFLSQGELITASAEVFPLAAIDRFGEGDGAITRIDRFLRPFVGIGAALLTDGEPQPAGGGRSVPTYGIRGFVAPLLTYGARLHLPSRQAPISLLLQYRQNHLFVGEAEFETPDAERLSGDSETLTWGTWSIGASFRIGG
jgi:hypothetical protein